MSLRNRNLSKFKMNSNGPAIFRDTNGFIASKGNFVLGKKEGVWEFYEKDKLVKKQNMSYPEGLSKRKKN